MTSQLRFFVPRWQVSPPKPGARPPRLASQPRPREESGRRFAGAVCDFEGKQWIAKLFACEFGVVFVRSPNLDFGTIQDPLTQQSCGSWDVQHQFSTLEGAPSEPAVDERSRAPRASKRNLAAVDLTSDLTNPMTRYPWSYRINRYKQAKLILYTININKPSLSAKVHWLWPGRGRTASQEARPEVPPMPRAASPPIQSSGRYKVWVQWVMRKP